MKCDNEQQSPSLVLKKNVLSVSPDLSHLSRAFIHVHSTCAAFVFKRLTEAEKVESNAIFCSSGVRVGGRRLL